MVPLFLCPPLPAALTSLRREACPGASLLKDEGGRFAGQRLQQFAVVPDALLQVRRRPQQLLDVVLVEVPQRQEVGAHQRRLLRV